MREENRKRCSIAAWNNCCEKLKMFKEKGNHDWNDSKTEKMNPPAICSWVCKQKAKVPKGHSQWQFGFVVICSSQI